MVGRFTRLLSNSRCELTEVEIPFQTSAMRTKIGYRTASGSERDKGSLGFQKNRIYCNTIANVEPLTRALTTHPLLIPSLLLGVLTHVNERCPLIPLTTVCTCRPLTRALMFYQNAFPASTVGTGLLANVRDAGVSL